MVLATHRVAPSESDQCSNLYLRGLSAVTRTSPLTPDEISARARFAAVSAMVKERKADLSKISTDQAAFLAQKDAPNGKKTMKAYYWLICGDEYDEAQG